MRINTIKGIAISMMMAAGMTFVSCADWDMPHYGAGEVQRGLQKSECHAGRYCVYG